MSCLGVHIRVDDLNFTIPQPLPDIPNGHLQLIAKKVAEMALRLISCKIGQAGVKKMQQIWENVALREIYDKCKNLEACVGKEITVSYFACCEFGDPRDMHTVLCDQGFRVDRDTMPLNTHFHITFLHDECHITRSIFSDTKEVETVSF